METMQLQGVLDVTCLGPISVWLGFITGFGNEITLVTLIDNLCFELGWKQSSLFISIDLSLAFKFTFPFLYISWNMVLALRA